MPALLLLVAARPAVAATAGDLFADGNRLFRDDLYWAALLRYREASEAGMDTPLLHYNMGIAHYRAKQHNRARTALQRAATYGPLAVISHYNLGLNAYAIGLHDEALGWFRQARDQQEREDISSLARRAIRQIRNEQAATVVLTPQGASEQRAKALTNLDFRIRVGAGTDSNVFRAPASPYIDRSRAALPVVTPIVQSGLYIPMSLRAKYQVNSLENEGFFGSYRLGGRYYQDQNLGNADEYLHEVAFGSEYRRREEDRETRVYSAFKIAQHDETWYDPDDGTERNIAGTDTSDRMSYLRYGPEFWLRKRVGALTVGGRVKGQLWNYSDTVTVPEYDHEYWNVGVNGQYRFTATSLLRVTAEYYTRRFGDRTAYELDGSQPLGNPGIRYDYAEFSIEARQRISRQIWFSLSYERTDRIDQYQGYNNYYRDSYGASLHMRLGDRFDVEASGKYSIYNYENAFAFHEPTAGRKTLETATGRVRATIRMTERFDLVAEYSLREVVSNDFRIQYSRNQGILAIRWSQ